MFKVYDTRMTTNVGCPSVSEFNDFDEASDFVLDYCDEEGLIQYTEMGDGNLDDCIKLIQEYVIIKEEK